MTDDVPDDLKTLRESVSTLLRVFLISEKVFPSAGGMTSYSPHEFQTIGFVARNPGCMANQIAAFLGVAPTTMTSLIDRLVKRGLLLRERPASNRRAVAISLTVEGSLLWQAILKQDYKNMAAMLDALEEQEKEPFIQYLSKIARHIRGIEGTAPGSR
jgi:DNA-binding MarR family transcriptional regulator